ncbi:MAG: ABC transporter substrate-binding protein [Deltaproteobacteria bacterium]|nr:ABC transporter substrate-binding protein [Deltaproteobacteria bacterium]
MGLRGVLTLAVAVAALLGASAGSAGAQQPSRVRIAVAFDTIGFSLPRLAHELGLFKKEGLEPEMPFAERVRALKGARIGTSSPGSYLNLSVRFILEDHGIHPDRDATIVPFGGSREMMAALERGRVDAMAQGSPVPEMIEARGIGRVLFHFNESPFVRETYGSSLVTTKGVTRAQPELVVRFMRAMVGTFRYVHDDFEGTMRIMAKLFPGFPPAVLRASLTNILQVIPRDPAIPESGLKSNMDFLIREGALTKPLPYSEVYTEEFLRKAR